MTYETGRLIEYCYMNRVEELQMVEGEKKMLTVCDCPLFCRHTISEDERVEIHREYWDMTARRKNVVV